MKVADFVGEDGDLEYFREDGTTVPVVPESKRKLIFQEAHSGCLAGHISARKIRRIL